MTAMATSEEAPGWLTKEEAAKYLRMHPDTLRRYANRGELKRYGSGKMQRFRQHDLDKFLEQHGS